MRPYYAGRMSVARYARLIPVGGSFAFESSFDRGLVDEFKRRIPSDGRSWDATAKRWMVAAQYGQACADVALEFLGVQVIVPALATVATTETLVKKLEYLGRTKDRGNGDASAFGWADGAWSLIFPETVLRGWFEATPRAPGEQATLYAALGLKQVSTEYEIRAAYRRMVKIWHPDVNRGDPDAAEQFMAVQHAYEVICDPLKRRKYDAGLQFAATLPGPVQGLTQIPGTYRAPLRSGYVLAEGVQQVGRFVVQTILAWQDIIDAEGRIMVASWPAGADKFEVSWQ